MTARAFAYVVVAAAMLTGSTSAQQPPPPLDLLVAQRPAPAPAGQPQPRGNPAQAPQPGPGDRREGNPPPALGPDGPPPPSPPPSGPLPRPRPENQSTNVRVEVTVTDERPGVAAIKKTVSIVTVDGLNGSVRSQTNYQAGALPGTAPFNVDATPIIMSDSKVHVRLTLQYDVVPPPSPTQDAVRLLGTSIRDSLALVLDNGKPQVVVQSSDPVSDRKVSVEVKATILK